MSEIIIIGGDVIELQERFGRLSNLLRQTNQGQEFKICTAPSSEDALAYMDRLQKAAAVVVLSEAGGTNIGQAMDNILALRKAQVAVPIILYSGETRDGILKEYPGFEELNVTYCPAGETMASLASSVSGIMGNRGVVRNRV